MPAVHPRSASRVSAGRGRGIARESRLPSSRCAIAPRPPSGRERLEDQFASTKDVVPRMSRRYSASRRPPRDDGLDAAPASAAAELIAAAMSSDIVEVDRDGETRRRRQGDRIRPGGGPARAAATAVEASEKASPARSTCMLDDVVSSKPEGAERPRAVHEIDPGGAARSSKDQAVLPGPWRIDAVTPARAGVRPVDAGDDVIERIGPGDLDTPPPELARQAERLGPRRDGAQLLRGREAGTRTVCEPGNALPCGDGERRGNAGWQPPSEVDRRGTQARAGDSSVEPSAATGPRTAQARIGSRPFDPRSAGALARARAA